ncbi:MFS transporter [Cohnella yongneupensis]|uniref:MFS transporter n=1 Tax=Cohnella yongneupensis TaxID=425006 RepID=A0ABW0QTS0_9BACL
MKNANPPTQSVDPRRWLSLSVIIVAVFMVVLDTFIVNVALPSIENNLHADFAKLQLIVAAYILGYAVLLITGGRMGDLYGRKKMFLTGVAGFVAASAWCGFAGSADMLIIARVFQGISAAAMTPQVLSLIHVTFPAGEKGKALGIYGAVLGLGAVTGQLVGGLLLQADWWGMGWRLVFLVNIPVGIAAFACALWLVRESRTAERKKMDTTGIGILTAGLVLFIYPIVVGREQGWPWWVFISLAASLAILAGFVRYESRLPGRGTSPLLPMTLFRERSFRLGIIIVSIFFSGNSALYLIFSVFMQSGRGATPMESAYAFVPMAIGFFSASLLAPRWKRRWGNRVLQAGALLMVIGYAALILILGYTSGLGLAEMFLPVLLAGFGQGAITSPLIHTVLADVQPQNAGAASGAFSTFMQISSAVGIAIIGTLYQSMVEHSGQSSLAAAHVHTLQWSLVILIALAMLTFVLLAAISSKRAPDAKPAEKAKAMAR